ncbi:hypothetical protein [Halopiger goleimassiliensis]|uniref:hypothetical protein n=1 Tax=Halopiger goleimassiliensis TaxID=1293048 RepID=UPI000677BE7A|nr:hypothetical protein [Halopiger goleimassiliensis]
MTGIARRRLLAGTGTALAGVLAGCSGGDDGGNGEDGTDENATDDERDADDEASPATGHESDVADDDASTDGDSSDAADGTVLGEVSLENVHDRAHTVDVIVEFDGHVEHWTTHDLEPSSGVTLERDWPTEPGSFRLLARRGDELTQVEPDRWNDHDCLDLVAFIGRDGELRFLVDNDGTHCGTTED